MQLVLCFSWSGLGVAGERWPAARAFCGHKILDVGLFQKPVPGAGRPKDTVCFLPAAVRFLPVRRPRQALIVWQLYTYDTLYVRISC